MKKVPEEIEEKKRCTTLLHRLLTHNYCTLLEQHCYLYPVSSSFAVVVPQLTAEKEKYRYKISIDQQQSRGLTRAPVAFDDKKRATKLLQLLLPLIEK